METEANLIREQLKKYGLLEVFQRIQSLEKENDELHNVVHDSIVKVTIATEAIDKADKYIKDLSEINSSLENRVTEYENRLKEYESKFGSDKLPPVIMHMHTDSSTNQLAEGKD